MTKAILTSIFVCTTAPLAAEELAPGEAIMAAISGNTVQGSMDASGAYTEVYDVDGTIKAADYTGAWSIEGDTMCFDYGEAPVECWSVGIDGDQITWAMEGKASGSGTLLEGNPNNF